MVKLGNRSTIRKVNQRSIVDYIIRYQGASRADIAKGLNLSKPAVSENVAELLEKNILVEGGVTDSKIGKKGTILRFNEEHAFVMVIDLTGNLYNNAVSVSICNLNYEEKQTFVVPIQSQKSSDLIQEIFANITNLGMNYEEIMLVVVSVSGIVNSKENRYTYSYQICSESASPSSFHEELEQGFQKPIFLFNDINLAVMGEYYLGNQEKRNMAYLWIDLAIGGSFILNGELYEGSIGAAGEIGGLKTAVMHNGHMEYVCLSDVLSINAINLTLQKEIVKSTFLSTRLVETGNVTYEDLIEGKKQLDPYCVSYCQSLVRTIVRLVEDIVLLLDLEYVVLGGHINLLGDDIYTEITNAIDIAYKQSMITVNPPLSVNSSLIGGYYYGVQKAMELLFL